MPYFGIPIRNGLPIGLGSVAGFGVAPAFSPSVLFAAGEQGAWYDPSDLTTLFQDAAGTTPSVMETRARLMLDKSKGLVQTTVYTNDGNTASGWVYSGGAGGSIAASGGKLVFTCATTLTALQDRLARYEITGLTTGQNYLVTASLQNISDGVGARLGIASSALAGDTTGTYVDTNSASLTPVQFIFTASSSTMYLRLIARVGNSNAQIGVDDIRVATLPGNHATAPSDASSPILRARYNLLQYSEDFSNAYWNKTLFPVTISTNAAVAPNGTLTADKIIATASSSVHYVFNDTGLPNIANASYTWSVYAKAAEQSHLYVNAYIAASAFTWFDLVNGTVGTNAAGSTASITPVGNGWFLCQVSRSRSTASPDQLFCAYGGAPSDNTSTYTGNGTDGIFVWGADLRTSADAALNIPAYQSITTATSYDTAGFPPYLAFDGTDDSFSTASIDFTGTDKMTVFAGVTKLSDAAAGVLVELGTAAFSTVGGFGIYAPGGAAPDYNSVLRGNSNSRSNVATTYSAPVSNVVTLQFDLAQALTVNGQKTRVNGLTPTLTPSQVTADYGGGTNANASLFIGRRNNSTFPLNGRIYSLIIRGAATTTPLIASTEQWVAGKMRLPI